MTEAQGFVALAMLALILMKLNVDVKLKFGWGGLATLFGVIALVELMA